MRAMVRRAMLHVAMSEQDPRHVDRREHLQLGRFAFLCTLLPVGPFGVLALVVWLHGAFSGIVPVRALGSEVEGRVACAGGLVR